MLWDIFCNVIDNHGDIGVTWRLSAELAARGEQVRLWVDDPSALAWMAPGGREGVTVIPWNAQPPAVVPGDVVVEAFGCDPHEAFVAALAERTRREGRQPAWINLEYLSAEGYVERCHGLPSPVMSGPARGLVKRFFYPGFTARTGGLIREAGLAGRQGDFDRAAWLARLAPQLRTENGEAAPDLAHERLVSLFCYEPAALPQLLRQLGQGPQPTRLLVTAGRAEAATRTALAASSGAPRPAISFLPLMPQSEFDALLWSCDLNFVRGEDSLVRALWAGRPFVWHIYPQDDGAHAAKLRAFLDWFGAPDSLRAAHEAWNGLGGALPPLDLAAWQPAAQDARTRLLGQEDLVTQLQRTADRTVEAATERAANGAPRETS